MISFLNRVAQHIFQHYPQSTEKICVVLPTKRAGLFLKKEIAKVFNKTIWAPQIISMDDFMSELSNSNTVSSFELTLHFYKVYVASTPADDRDDFNDFLNWAPALLADFDAVDRHLVNPEKFFNYINETRALEVWNVDGQPISDFQKEYLRFWQNLKTYYSALNESLAKENLVSSGQAYRKASEFNDFESTKWSKVIFAGLNALTPSEEKIIQKSIKAGWAEILWDSDEYYLHNRNQEAGFFLRKYLNSWSNDFSFKEDLLSKENKNIHLIGCPQNVLQAHVAAELIQTKIPANSPNSAVILGDENLLIPLLNQLPDETKAANITMGLPIKQIDLYPMLLQLFVMHETAKKSAKDYVFYHKDLLLFLAHEKIQFLLGDKRKTIELNNYITKNNRVYITVEKCLSILGEELRFIFESGNKNGSTLLQNMLQLITLLKDKYSETSSLENEYLFAFYTFLQKLNNLQKKYELTELEQLKALKKVFIKLIRQEKLSFYGEPLQGLQIMGMLESRALDFENIILLSMNEGVIPKDKHQQSFIPHDIKKEFGLHTYQENDAIFAYHFYRLIQRAKNVYFLYTSASDNMGGQNEKSRFLSQLEMEYAPLNKNVHFTSEFASLPNSEMKVSSPILRNTPDIIDRLKKRAAKGFSPSAINKFLECPSDFYYRYILGLGEMDEVEEDIQASSLGTAIHTVLENLYQNHVGKVLQIKDVEVMLPQVDSLLEKAFQAQEINELQVGKNHLTYNVAGDVIKQFLQNEITTLKELELSSQSLTILKLEYKMEGEIEINLHGEPLKIKLTGIADRIDKIGNEIRLVDYKTGKVAKDDLTIQNLDNIGNGKKSKLLQLLWYSLLYLENNKDVDSITPGLLSFRALSQGLFELNVERKDKADRETCLAFKKQLILIFDKLFSEEIEYVHNVDAKYCGYC
jgi:ATP-dependent helicase/nuclease subunit B